MHPSGFRWLLAAAVSFFIAASAMAAPGLRFEPEVGREQRYEFKSEHLISMQSPDTPRMERRSSVTMDISVTLKSLDDSGAVLDVSMIAYAFTNEVGGKHIAWDSRKPADDELSKQFEAQFRPLMGVPVTVRIDAMGKVTEVTGAEALPQGPAARKMAVELFSVSGMQRKLGLAFGTRAPENEAKVDLTWESKDIFEMPGMGDVPAETTHTIGRMEGPAAHITVKSECELPKPPDASIALEKVVFEGVQQWDTEQGLLQRYDGVQSGTAHIRRGSKEITQDFQLSISLVRQ